MTDRRAWILLVALALLFAALWLAGFTGFDPCAGDPGPTCAMQKGGRRP